MERFMDKLHSANQVNSSGQNPKDISENDDSRSYYIWKLIQKLRNRNCQNDTIINIPRRLIQFWDNMRTVPADVQCCMDSWSKLDDYGFSRILFDDELARRYIIDNFDERYLKAFNQCNHPAMRADYFRLCFLYKEGGFYVDADDIYNGYEIESLFSNGKLKIQLLCYDKLMNNMVSNTGFISDSKYNSNYIYYVNNDPIVSPAKHPLIFRALERSTQRLLQLRQGLRDIQSVTGPGNLSASLVQHAIEVQRFDKELDFEFIFNWDDISIPQWPLDYRNDKRNWRIWDGTNM
jgi:hypothetical protein